MATSDPTLSQLLAELQSFRQAMDTQHSAMDSAMKALKADIKTLSKKTQDLVRSTLIMSVFLIMNGLW
jgi:hypothetical protein